MDTLNVKLRTVDENVKFAAVSRENPEVAIDYFPPVGTGQGYTSLELLMASFGSCISTTVLTLLRHRMHKTVSGIAANVMGEVRDSHPKALTRMHATLHIQAKDLSELEVRHVLQLAEDTLCPVWAMLKGNVAVDFTIEISK